METGVREVVLRRGLVDESGARHRRAIVRPLTGRQEAALASGGIDARAASELLAACVDRLGGYREVSDVHTAALGRGDRWQLALALRQLMVGDRLVLTVTCPDPDCGEQADLDLRVSDLLGGVADAQPEEVEIQTPDGRLHLRPPIGLDDEACEAAGDRSAQSAMLWSRLVLDVGGRGPIDPTGWRALHSATRQAAAVALADLENAPDLSFVSPCPACGAWIELELDPFELLAHELGWGAGRLLAEVHCLAYHYGWSEDAILDLPRTRRWRYLELLRNQLEGRPLVDLWS